MRVMHQDLLTRYDRRVPRYTSYPTAPHFHAGIGPDHYAGWLEAVPRDEPLSLYVHIPFCDTLCWFCGCHTTVVRRYGPIASYLGLIEAELDLVAARLPQGVRLGHLHWGGGSPTTLAPDDIRRLGARLLDRLPAAAAAEIAVEIDPRGLGDETIAALAAIGVTRASIGVQDVNPEVQAAINRIQPPEVTRSAVDRLRAAGIARLNLDLVYGLPHQDVGRLLDTLDTALALRPDRLALFGYAHVPGFKAHQRLIPETALPGPVERLAQAETAAARLEAAGYVRIGLDHFALPDDPLARAAATDTLSRNFQGYTTDRARTLVGLGASAIGALPQGYVQNAVPVPRYREALAAGRLPVTRGIALTADDRRRRGVIEALLCRLAVDLRDHADLAELPDLDRFETDGLIDRGDGLLRVTARGRPFLRTIAAAFDAHLDPAGDRHVRAV